MIYQRMGWENEYLGDEERILFYPDSHANYWAFTLNPKHYRRLALRLTGTLPAARYMSINLYLHASKQSVGSITDTDLYRPDRQYEVWIAPKAMCLDQAHVLHFEQGKGRYSIFLRYYDPIGDPYGQVDLPQIEAIDIDAQRSVPLPHVAVNLLSMRTIPYLFTRWLGWKNKRKPFQGLNPAKLHAYRHSGKGFFPNHDNLYLYMPIVKRKDEVVIIRVQTPRFAQDMHDDQAEVRYWSLALCTTETETHHTLIDREAIVHEDGYVYVALVREAPDTSMSNWNVIPWTIKGNKAVLIYRHLLTSEDYPHAMKQVQAFSLYDPRRIPASTFIQDHSPVGKVMSKQEFDTRWPAIFWES